VLPFSLRDHGILFLYMIIFWHDYGLLLCIFCISTDGGGLKLLYTQGWLCDFGFELISMGCMIRNMI
jgi:hypothetical protein